MTIASLIVDVAANTAALNTGVKEIQGQLDKVGSIAKGLAATLGVTFGATAVIGFGKALLDDADALMRMHDTTGVSLQGLQRFQIAADDAGNTLDQVTSSIVKMENRLVGGDGSALSALTQLGIPFQDIKNLSPENQFIAISDAIRGVHDPAKQVALAIDIFGKSGADALPILKRGFDDVKGAAVGMSDETIKAMDEAGDTVGRWSRLVKGYAAEATVYFVRFVESGLNPMRFAFQQSVREMEAIKSQLSDMESKLPDPRVMAEPFKAITSDAPEVKQALRDIEEDLKRQQKAASDAADALEKTRQKQEHFTQSVKDATIHMNLSIFALHRFGATALPDVHSSLDGVDTEINDLASTTMPAFEMSIYQIGERGRKVFGDLRTGAQKLGDDLESVLLSVPQTLASALTGGGGIMGGVQAIGSQVGSVLGSTIGKSISMLGKFGGPIGAAIGSLAGPAISGIVGLFRDEKGIETNRLRDGFVSAAGGLEVLNVTAHNAGATLDRLLDARTPEAYKAAIDELNGAFAFQDQSMQTLTDTVAKYNFTNDQIGPILQRQNLHATFAELFQDYSVLHASGLDQVAVTQQMSSKVSQFAQDSIRMGIEVPASMRAMLQNFADNGDLLDINGDKITDLSKAGLTFSDTMTQSVQKVIDSVQKLVDAITRGLNPAIANIPQPAPISIPFSYDYTGTNGIPDAIPQANGGDWMVTKPTLFLAGEAGPERATFTPSGKSRQGDSGSDVSSLRGELAGLRSDLNQQQRGLPRLIRDAVLLATA